MSDSNGAPADANANQGKACPIDHHNSSTTAPLAPKSSWSNLFGFFSLREATTPQPPSDVNPANNLPPLSQRPVPGQRVELSKDREVSTIPRAFAMDATQQQQQHGATADAASCPHTDSHTLAASRLPGMAHSASPDGTFSSDGVDDPNTSQYWVYPSSQQFHQALARKGWETPEEHVDMMVAIHNFLNEGCWQEVLKWEKLHEKECPEPRLLRLRGRPDDLSPKARILGWFGTPRPFDRHDWVVSRCGREVRYVIDYYSAPSEGDTPVFSVDVRPALDSPQSVIDRLNDDVHRCYLKSWIRERFRYFRFLKSPVQIQRQITEGAEVEQRLTRALVNDSAELKFIDDLAYGRFGRLYDVINWIKSYDNPNKPCIYLTDTRPKSSRNRDRHPKYRIPLDPRVFVPPAHLYNRSILDREPPKIPEKLQVYDVVSTSGFRFKRIRHMHQTVRLSRKIRCFIRDQQDLHDTRNLFEGYLADARVEDEWLKSLGLDHGYEPPLIDALTWIDRQLDKVKSHDHAVKKDYVVRYSQLYAKDF
ncbi:holocytochrome c synthase [Dimargaris xerosporica]|nr:holocytochrome c synthase [Dimargaris xerosporica]